MLAETCFQHGRAEEGLAAVAEAAEPMKRTHEQMWEAEFARTGRATAALGCPGRRC
jgi:hypothetical protein